MGTAAVIAQMPLHAHAATCTDSNWSGAFGYKLTGSSDNGQFTGRRAAVGTLVSDGKGNLTGTETQSTDGTITTGLTFAGTYTVLKDCSGTATVTLSSTEVRHFNVVIVSTGKEVIGIQTDHDTEVTMTVTKQ
jgi:hypothetical protein